MQDAKSEVRAALVQLSILEADLAAFEALAESYRSAYQEALRLRARPVTVALAYDAWDLVCGEVAVARDAVREYRRDHVTPALSDLADQRRW